jgi:hypothetical protein
VLDRFDADFASDARNVHFGFVMDLRLDSREGVLTEVMNNGTHETRGFRQVRASLRIITLCPMCVGV